MHATHKVHRIKYRPNKDKKILSAGVVISTQLQYAIKNNLAGCELTHVTVDTRAKITIPPLKQYKRALVFVEAAKSKLFSFRKIKNAIYKSK